jgi:alpha-mannosidase
MSKFGIADVIITRVTRIHNRFLRNRFEENLEQLVDLSDPSYKRSLE